VLTSIFFSLFFQPFRRPPVGCWESTLGALASFNGSVPFRDYFVTSPPLNQSRVAFCSACSEKTSSSPVLQA